MRRTARNVSTASGQGELLADEAGNEPAAADLAACFHPPVDLQQYAPRRGAYLARQQLAQNDAVAAQQLAREDFVGFLGLRWELLLWSAERTSDQPA